MSYFLVKKNPDDKYSFLLVSSSVNHSVLLHSGSRRFHSRMEVEQAIIESLRVAAEIDNFSIQVSGNGTYVLSVIKPANKQVLAMCGGFEHEENAALRAEFLSRFFKGKPELSVTYEYH